MLKKACIMLLMESCACCAINKAYKSWSKHKTCGQEICNKLKMLQYYHGTKNFPWGKFHRFAAFVPHSSGRSGKSRKSTVTQIQSWTRVHQFFLGLLALNS
jgi:hypothetical protein